MMDLPTTVSVGTAVIVFCLTVIVLPLVRYIVVAKDRQIDDLKRQIAESDREHEEFKTRMHAIELKVTKLEGEVEVANGVHTRLDKLTDRLDTVVRELGSMQTALNLMMRGKLSGRSTSDFPAVKPEGG